MFVKTKEYLEFEEDMRELVRFIKKPANIVMTILFGSTLIAFYFIMIILADVAQGAL